MKGKKFQTYPGTIPSLSLKLKNNNGLHRNSSIPFNSKNFLTFPLPDFFLKKNKNRKAIRLFWLGQ